MAVIYYVYISGRYEKAYVDNPLCKRCLCLVWKDSRKTKEDQCLIMVDTDINY